MESSHFTNKVSSLNHSTLCCACMTARANHCDRTAKVCIQSSLQSRATDHFQSFEARLIHSFWSELMRRERDEVKRELLM